MPVAVVQLRGRWSLVRRNLRLDRRLRRWCAVAGCQLAYFNAVAHMQVGVALLIEYTAPVAVVGWLWLRRGAAARPADVVGVRWSAPSAWCWSSTCISGAHDEPHRHPVGARRDGRARRSTSCSRRDEDNGLPPHRARRRRAALGGLRCSSPALSASSRCTASTRPVAYDAVHRAVVGPGARARRGDRGRWPTAPASPRPAGSASRLASFVALSEVLAALVFAWLLLGEVPAPVQLVGGVLDRRRRGDGAPGRAGRRLSRDRAWRYLRSRPALLFDVRRFRAAER